MSTWRDIWRYGVIANRLFAENEERGELAFKKLMEVYDKPDKAGEKRQDGMIRYIQAEAYEKKYWETNKSEYKEKALEKYNNAKNMFPVDHWKKVANDSWTRLNTNTKLQDFYNIRIERKPKLIIHASFDDLLWYGFQKVYTFVHLNDFARYVCLSALSRGSSEWPLSLIDFRTVLELEIKQCFPEVVDKLYELNGSNNITLEKITTQLKSSEKIETDVKAAFDNIRTAGNLATHDPGVLKDEFKTENVVRFIDVLSSFEDYRREHLINYNKKNPYPLCQLSLDELISYLDKEKESLLEKNYYD